MASPFSRVPAAPFLGSIFSLQSIILASKEQAEMAHRSSDIKSMLIPENFLGEGLRIRHYFLYICWSNSYGVCLFQPDRGDHSIKQGLLVGSMEPYWIYATCSGGSSRKDESHTHGAVVQVSTGSQHTEVGLTFSLQTPERWCRGSHPTSKAAVFSSQMGVGQKSHLHIKKTSHYVSKTTEASQKGFSTFVHL